MSEQRERAMQAGERNGRGERTKRGKWENEDAGNVFFAGGRGKVNLPLFIFIL